MDAAISVGSNLTGGSTHVCYKIPVGYVGAWNLMYLHNSGGNTKYITAKWYDASASSEYTILNEYSMAAKDYLKFDGGAYVMLDEGDEIRVTPETGSTFSVINTIKLTRKK